MAIATRDEEQRQLVCPTADGQRTYSAVCPHMGGPLDQGRVENGEVVCPWHRYRYDLTTGEGRGLARLLGLCLRPSEAAAE